MDILQAIFPSTPPHILQRSLTLASNDIPKCIDILLSSTSPSSTTDSDYAPSEASSTSDQEDFPSSLQSDHQTSVQSLLSIGVEPVEILLSRFPSWPSAKLKETLEHCGGNIMDAMYVMEMADKVEPVNVLACICPGVERRVLIEVLAECLGDVEMAAEKVFEKEREVAKVSVMSNILPSLPSPSIKNTSKKTNGREYDVQTLMDMFPDRPIPELRQLLKLHGGLHKTVDYLTRQDSSIPRPQKQKEPIPSFRDIVASDLSNQDEYTYHTSLQSNSPSPTQTDQKFGWQTIPTKKHRKQKLKLNYTFSDSSSNSSSSSSSSSPPLQPSVPTPQHHDFEQVKNLTSEYCREQALKHHVKRVEAFQTAASFYKRGNMTSRATASFYADQGHTETKSMNHWNHLASLAILRDNSILQNNPHTLDLHGLTRAEAIQALDERINAWYNSNGANGLPSRPLKVITGSGTHSKKHQPVLLPAALKHVRKQGWRVGYEVGNGFFYVLAK
ncbi:hypothetical protein HDU97_006846 [Phlyctochytrium planicorne]|nr:hypothetical protein HDU97_006846 [Phlyctochytrium planicorne]